MSVEDLNFWVSTYIEVVACTNSGSNPAKKPKSLLSMAVV